MVGENLFGELSRELHQMICRDGTTYNDCHCFPKPLRGVVVVGLVMDARHEPQHTLPKVPEMTDRTPATAGMRSVTGVKDDAQLNESPQAQLPVALGLSMVKPCFSIVSTKSMVAPCT